MDLRQFENTTVLVVARRRGRASNREQNRTTTTERWVSSREKQKPDLWGPPCLENHRPPSPSRRRCFSWSQRKKRRGQRETRWGWIAPQAQAGILPVFYLANRFSTLLANIVTFVKAFPKFCCQENFKTFLVVTNKY